MNEQEKLKKFISRLQHLVKCLDSLQALCVHRHINHSYYMQKVAELEFLHEQMSDLLKKQEANLNLVSVLAPEIFNRWKHDVRWLRAYSIRHEIDCPHC